MAVPRTTVSTRETATRHDAATTYTTVYYYRYYGYYAYFLLRLQYSLQLTLHAAVTTHITDTTQNKEQLPRRIPRGGGTPTWNRRGCSSGIFNLTPKGDHLGVAKAFCGPLKESDLGLA